MGGLWTLPYERTADMLTRLAGGWTMKVYDHSAPLLVAPSAGVIVLMSLALIAAAAAMLLQPSHDMPHATCPDMARVQDKGDCAHWSAQIITDIRFEMLPGGSCRVCNVRLGR